MATDWNVWGTIKQAAGLWFRKDGYALKVTPTGTTLTADRTINLPNANADTTLVTTDGIQTLTNKAIDGGTASANNKLKLPEDTYANLVSLAGKAEGQIFYANDVDKVYYYNGTALVEVGSGSGTGKKNYILNPSAATDVSKWTASNFTATKDTSTAIPRETTTGTAFKLVSTNTTATFLSDAMLLDDTDLSKKLGVELAINVADSSNWTIDVLASDLAGGTYARLPLSTDVAAVTTLPATVGTFKTTVDMVAATPYIKFRITSAATAKTAYFSDILVTPDGNTVAGPVIEAGKSYAFTTNLSNSTTTFYGQRVGEYLELEMVISLSGNGGTSTDATITFPAGMTVNTSLMSISNRERVAFGWEDVSTTTVKNVFAAFPTTSTIKFVAETSTIAYLNRNALDNGDSIIGQIRIPIAEWAGSGTVNLAQNDEEYASNSSTTDADDTAALAYGPSGSLVPTMTASATNANRAKRVSFQTPIQSGDSIVIEIQDSGTGAWIPVGVNNNYIARTYQNAAGTTAFYGIGWVAVNSTTIDVGFGRAGRITSGTGYGTAGPSYPANAGDKWRVRKTSGGKAIGFSAATVDSMGLVSKEYRYPGSALTLTYPGGGRNGNSFSSGSMYVTRVGTGYFISIQGNMNIGAANTRTTYILSNTGFTWPAGTPAIATMLAAGSMQNASGQGLPVHAYVETSSSLVRVTFDWIYPTGSAANENVSVGCSFFIPVV